MTSSYLLHVLVVISASLITTIDAANPTFLVPIASTAPRSVDEDEASGTSILTLEGQDTDGDTLTFSIVTQDPTSPPFELESGSGLLKVPSGLDYEFSTSYEFVFGVRDGSTTTNSVSYTVNIVDVNEAPEFNPLTYPETVLESEPIGTSVTSVTATDPDVTPAFNTITYSIVSGNNPAWFALDQNTGKINVSATLNATTYPSFSLQIQASDGTNTAATRATVTITVIATTTTAATTTTDQPTTTVTTAATGDKDNETECEVGCVIGICVGVSCICVGGAVLLIKHNKDKEERTISPGPTTESGNDINKDFPGNGHIKSSLPPSETMPKACYQSDRHDLKSASRSSKLNREFSKDEKKLDINM